jgi:Prokaryotic Cytochrome C oxidase subunit IV
MSLTQTWTLLVALSVLTAAVTMLDPARPVLALGVLVLAGMKARLILGRYLRLNTAPAWQKGFDLALALLLLAFAGLALAR